MKCTVWFDLPKALVNLSQDIISEKEKQHVSLLTSLSKNLQSEFEALSSTFVLLSPSLCQKEITLLKEKLLKLNKERVDLVCKSIKVSIQLISQFITYIEKNQHLVIEKEILLQIKLLMKITRIFSIKAKEEISNSKITKEKRFFNLILAYSEKTQNKLYELSTNIVKRVMIRDSKFEEINSKVLLKCDTQ